MGKEYIFLVVQLVVLLFSSNNYVSAGPGLQMPEEEPIFEDLVPSPKSPRYILPHDYRLPEGLVPEHYVVHIRPILDQIGDEPIDIAPGSVKMFVECTKDTINVTFHSVDIAIDHSSTQILDESDQSIKDFQDFYVDTDLQIVVLTMAPGHELKAGSKYSIFLKFTAQIPHSLLGMYHRFYDSPDGQKKLVLTKLEAVGARMVFPCFDEPALKATYQINIAHIDKYNTLCNMEIVNQHPDPDLEGWTWDEYNTTVKMSTYLIAIVVSEFKSVAADPDIYRPDKPVLTWAAPHHIDNGGGIYAAIDTALALKHFTEWYELEYPMPKMFSAAIPQFSSGAMEQWGIITYRDDYLLYFPGTTTEAERYVISRIIAHEVVHQWFGNIVTLEWWNSLWLNEGYARHLEKVGMSESHPEFEANHVSTDRISSMVADAGATTKPVHYNGDNLSGIVYDKASFLIRMMEKFLTAGTFWKGVNNYLAANQWGNVIQKDLFDKLTEQGFADGTLNTTLTVNTIMDTWTRQSGFPLVRIGRISSDRVFVSQERFGSTPRLTDGEGVLDPTDLWTIPLTFATKSNPDFSLANQQPKEWMDKTLNFVTVNVESGESDWIVANVDASAYYRVIYDDGLTAALKSQLDTNITLISPATRSQIIDDHFKSAFEKYIPIGTALDFTTFLKDEPTWMVWQTFVTNFRSSYILLRGHSKHAEEAKVYLSKILSGGLDLFGVKQLPGDKGAGVIGRVALLDWSCGLGLDICMSYAKELFDEWKENPSQDPVPVDLRPVMYCAIVWSGEEKAWDFFVDKYTGESEKLWPFNIKPLYRNALSCPSDPSLIGLTMRTSILEPDVPPADGIQLLIRLAGNFAARDQLMEFLNNSTNLDAVIGRHGVKGVQDVIAALVVHWSEIERIDQLNTFIDANSGKFETILPALRNSVKVVENNFKWMNTFGNDMGAWLAEQNAINPTEPPSESFGTRISSSYMMTGFVVLLISIYCLM